jgi:hypothetical protein
MRHSAYPCILMQKESIWFPKPQVGSSNLPRVTTKHLQIVYMAYKKSTLPAGVRNALFPRRLARKLPLHSGCAEPSRRSRPSCSCDLPRGDLQRVASYQSSARLAQLTRHVSVERTYLSSFDDKYRFIVNHINFAILLELLILLYRMI